MTGLHAVKATDMNSSLLVSLHFSMDLNVSHLINEYTHCTCAVQGLEKISDADEQMQTIPSTWRFRIQLGGGENSATEGGFPASQPITPDQFSRNCSYKFLSFVPMPRTIPSTCLGGNTGCSARFLPQLFAEASRAESAVGPGDATGNPLCRLSPGKVTSLKQAGYPHRGCEERSAVGSITTESIENRPLLRAEGSVVTIAVGQLA